MMKHSHKLSEQDHKEMVRLYIAGEPISEIVERFGVNVKMLSYVRKKYGIPRRPMPRLRGEDHWNFSGGRVRS
jgi:hypothetical protein